ncbi:hypothetical protein [Clostridium sp. ATCC 25772]|nr:hypothetical protein [Clostridium sp. ATCC 25772]
MIMAIFLYEKRIVINKKSNKTIKIDEDKVQIQLENVTGSLHLDS